MNAVTFTHSDFNLATLFSTFLHYICRDQNLSELSIKTPCETEEKLVSLLIDDDKMGANRRMRRGGLTNSLTALNKPALFEGKRSFLSESLLTHPPCQPLV